MDAQALRRIRNSHVIPVEMREQSSLAFSQCASHLAHVKVAPPDAVFLTKAMYNKDPNPSKIDLGIGAYRTNEAKPYVLNIVKKVEKEIVADATLNKEYLGIAGHPQFCALSQALIFGKESAGMKEKRIVTVQCLSGTGALRVGCEFISKTFPNAPLYISNPTWGNHRAIGNEAKMKVAVYRYWDEKSRGLDLKGMLEDLRAAPKSSVIMLHACAHNPTGVDPTPEQWQQIAKVMQEKDHIPLFDSAYQGFASGDLSKDAYSIRLFEKLGFTLFVTQSYAKNCGLYSERVGALHVVCKDTKEAEAVHSQLEAVIRPMYSNPPKHGALIVAKILSDPNNFAEWENELRTMSGRIISMRRALFDELKALKTPGDWNHILTQIGMFSYTGLTPAQCKNMIEKHHVYMLTNGRISMAGVTTHNVKHLARALDDSVRNVKAK